MSLQGRSLSVPDIDSPQRSPVSIPPEIEVIREDLHSGSSAEAHPDGRVYRPFDDFPPELLSYILALARNSYNKEDSHARFIFPSLFSRVNCYFNLIVLSTPTLWSHLQITSISSLTHIQDRIQNRCGALPLDVDLIFHRTGYRDARQMLEATMAWVSLRCRSLVLRYDEPAIIEIPENGHYWDHLQVFTSSNPLRAVQLSIEGAAHPPLDLLPAFDSSVRFISLSRCRFRWLPATLPVNLQELLVHEQEETRVATAEIASCLRGSLRHSLRSLSLSGFFVGEENGKPESPCCLELLDYLELDRFSFDEATLLLGFLSTPNLRRLSLHVVIGGYASRELIAAWRNLRFPNLQKLKLQDFQAHKVRLVELIQNLPSSVRYLKIVENLPVKALMDQSATVFCGQLHHIVAHGVHIWSLARLVEGRCTSLQTLAARYRVAADVYRDLNQKRLRAYLDVLERSVPQLKIMADGGDPETSEPKYLTLEELEEDFLLTRARSLNPE